MSWRPNFDRTQCPDNAKNSRIPDVQKTKSVLANKTGKAEAHVADSQSWNSCHRVVSDYKFAFSSAKKKKKKLTKHIWALTVHYA